MLSLKALIHKSLLLKLLVSVGLLLLLSLAVWGFFNFRYMQKKWWTISPLAPSG